MDIKSNLYKLQSVDNSPDSRFGSCHRFYNVGIEFTLEKDGEDFYDQKRRW